MDGLLATMNKLAASGPSPLGQARGHATPKLSDDQRTVPGQASAGCPHRESEARAPKHAKNSETWAREIRGEAVRRIDAPRRRIVWTSTKVPAPIGDTSSEEGNWHKAYSAAEAAKAACGIKLGGSPAAQ